jgi:hypothetical protein
MHFFFDARDADRRSEQFRAIIRGRGGSLAGGSLALRQT